jgi:hypothetical protein
MAWGDVGMLVVEIDNQSGRAVFVRGNVAGLPDQHQIPAGTTWPFQVSAVEAGRIYLSFAALSTNAPDGANPHDPDYKTRFEKVELTYKGGNGKANLTAVDFYAIPLMLQTFVHAADQASVPVEQFSLKAEMTGAKLEQALLSAATDPAAASVKINTETVRILSPVKASAAYGSMAPYVTKVVTAAQNIQINGMYYGSPAKDYAYTGKIDATNIALENKLFIGGLVTYE